MIRKIPAMVCLMAGLVGCGGGGDAVGGKGKEPVYPVSGVVTYKGKAIANADVTFTSESGNRGAFGRTNEEGKFKLSTFGVNDGAIAGKHTVTIVKAKAVAAPAKKEADTFSPNYEPPKPLTEADPAFHAPPAGTSEIPAKYASVATSGLIAVVNADSPNDLKLDLED